MDYGVGLNRDAMRNKAAQIYGYVVCIIAIVTFLISLGTLINAVLDMNAPLYSSFQHEVNLTSFENYKVDVMQNISEDAAYIPSDTELMRMYESAREDAIAHRTHTVTKNMIVSSILILVSVVLFYIHLKWMILINRRDSETVSA